MDNTEKVSVNINISTLSQIDLLIDKGYYSNRSDFINYAIRECLESKQNIINETKESYAKYNFIWFLGIHMLSIEELYLIKKNGNKKEIKGYGLLLINDEIDDLVIETISSINIKGKVKCSERLKKYFKL